MVWLDGDLLSYDGPGSQCQLASAFRPTICLCTYSITMWGHCFSLDGFPCGEKYSIEMWCGMSIRSPWPLAAWLEFFSFFSWLSPSVISQRTGHRSPKTNLYVFLLQVRYLKIIEKSGYQALPWVRYITQNGGKKIICCVKLGILDTCSCRKLFRLDNESAR